MSRMLFERLAEGTIEHIIVPEAIRDPDMASVNLASVENAWMAKPEVLPKQAGPMWLDQLVHHPILTEGSRSGSGLYFSKWLKSQGVNVSRLIATFHAHIIRSP